MLLHEKNALQFEVQDQSAASQDMLLMFNLFDFLYFFSQFWSLHVIFNNISSFLIRYRDLRHISIFNGFLADIRWRYKVYCRESYTFNVFYVRHLNSKFFRFSPLLKKFVTLTKYRFQASKIIAQTCEKYNQVSSVFLVIFTIKGLKLWRQKNENITFVRFMEKFNLLVDFHEKPQLNHLNLQKCLKCSLGVDY